MELQSLADSTIADFLEVVPFERWARLFHNINWSEDCDGKEIQFDAEVIERTDDEILIFVGASYDPIDVEKRIVYPQVNVTSSLVVSGKPIAKRLQIHQLMEIAINEFLAYFPAARWRSMIEPMQWEEVVGETMFSFVAQPTVAEDDRVQVEVRATTSKNGDSTDVDDSSGGSLTRSFWVSG